METKLPNLRGLVKGTSEMDVLPQPSELKWRITHKPRLQGEGPQSHG